MVADLAVAPTRLATLPSRKRRGKLRSDVYTLLEYKRHDLAFTPVTNPSWNWFS